MSTVIETGKTVEEALEKALVALGRSVDEVDYEVLEQPSRGFFGLFGGHMARLRVTEKQAAPDASAFAAPAAAAAQPARPGQDVPDAAPAAGTPRARAEQFLRDIFRVQEDLPLRGQVKAGDHTQSRSLSAAGRAQESHEFAFFDFQIKIGNSQKAVLEFFGQMF